MFMLTSPSLASFLPHRMLFLSSSSLWISWGLRNTRETSIKWHLVKRSRLDWIHKQLPDHGVRWRYFNRLYVLLPSYFKAVFQIFCKLSSHCFGFAEHGWWKKLGWWGEGLGPLKKVSAQPLSLRPNAEDTGRRKGSVSLLCTMFWRKGKSGKWLPLSPHPIRCKHRRDEGYCKPVSCSKPNCLVSCVHVHPHRSELTSSLSSQGVNVKSYLTTHSLL